MKKNHSVKKIVLLVSGIQVALDNYENEAHFDAIAKMRMFYVHNSNVMKHNAGQLIKTSDILGMPAICKKSYKSSSGYPVPRPTSGTITRSESVHRCAKGI